MPGKVMRVRLAFVKDDSLDLLHTHLQRIRFQCVPNVLFNLFKRVIILFRKNAWAEFDDKPIALEVNRSVD